MNSGTGADAKLFWPLIIRAIGTVLMFLPLNLATLGPIPKKDVSAAAGFFNLTRQLGGSVGVALLTTLLADRTRLPPQRPRGEARLLRPEDAGARRQPSRLGFSWPRR